MTRGCIIFAYNGEIDYGSQAVVAAKLVQRHLGVPVSIITDVDTYESIQTKFNQLPFDKIILTDIPNDKNKRILSNGTRSSNLISFVNGNRNHAWELTPYDRTLVIDSDFLVLSNALNQYWDVDYDFLITPGMIDLAQVDRDPKDFYISKYSISMLWATNIMFTKNAESKLVFDLVLHIKENYAYYAALYYFDPVHFRNDYAFSIACHIMSNHGQDPWHGELPCPVLIRDIDEIHKVQEEQITFILKDRKTSNNSILARTKHQDVHVMNKYSILNKLDDLLKVAENVAT